MKRVNIFLYMDTDLVKGSETRTEGSSKRAGEELESENLKKQKLEAEVDDDQEEVEMKSIWKIVPEMFRSVAFGWSLAIILNHIVDWKIIKEGNMGSLLIHKSDGSSKKVLIKDTDASEF
ncbi:hypothetical protein Tco_1554663 [Tanacetum coccineum]